MLLFLAIILTCSAPLLVAGLGRLRAGGKPACAAPLHLPRYVYALLALLAAIGIVPPAFNALGWASLAALGFGLVAPWASKRLVKDGVRKFRPIGARQSDTGLFLVALGLGGIALHSFLDGAVLFSFGAPSASPILAPLVLLDRVTLGFVAWALLMPLGGRVTGAVGLVVIAAMTALGYAAVGFITAQLAFDPVVAWINAALSGVVLYLMISHAVEHGRSHHHHHGIVRGKGPLAPFPRVPVKKGAIHR